MSQIRYRQLPPEYKDKLCNGCGGKGEWIKMPNFLYLACCDHHDFNYWIGCTKKARRRADFQFYKAMLSDAMRFGGLRCLWYFAWATTYFLAVRCFGAKYFYFAQRERGWRELIEMGGL